MSWNFDTDITSNVTTSNTDSRNMSTTSSSANTSTTDNSDRSNRSNTNIGTGDNSKKSTFSSHDDSQHNVSSTIQNERIEANTTNIGTGDNSSRTQNRSEIRSDRNEVKHDTRISTADSSIHYNMASNSVVNIHSPQGVTPLQFVTLPQSAATPMAVKQLPAMPESTKTGILGFLGALMPKKKPAEVLSEPFDESLVKPQIIESNMNEDMKDEIKGVLYLAHEKSGNTKDRGIFIREKLNSKYSHEWHCIIGTELDGCMARNDNYMQLKYKGQTYVIFKTPSPQLHMNLENNAAVLSINIGDLKNRLESLEDQKSKLTNENIAYENLVAILTAEKNDLHREKSTLEAEKSNLINENAKLVKQVSSLELKNNNLQKENSEIKVEKTNLNDKITNLNDKLNEYMKKEKNQDEKIEEIQKENQKLQTEKSDVENKNSGLIDEIKKLSTQVESMNKKLEEAKPILKLRNEEIVEAYRSKYNLKDDKNIIMERACEYGAIEVVRALLDLGFGANDRVDGSLTGLHYAVWNNRANVVSLLLDRGTDVNLRRTDSDGWTPLMYAAYYGSLESAKVLVTRGADKYLRSTDSSKRTALGWARHNNKQDMIKYLKSVGVPE